MTTHLPVSPREFWQAQELPPAIPGTPAIAGTRLQPIATVPSNLFEVRALRARREELSSQLISAAGRRNDLAAELRTADRATSAGLVDRLRVLDERIVQLETDIAETGRLLTMTPAHLLVTTTTQARDFGPFSSGQATAVTIVGTIFVLAPLAIALARLMWRRGTRMVASPPSPEVSQRLERIEQAVDAIALEVERVAENQRFVTRLMTEGAATPIALGGGAADAARVPERQAIRAE